MKATKITPLSIYESITDKEYSFLLESPNADNKLERYSFIGFDPACIIESRGHQTAIKENGKTRTVSGDPFEILKDILNKHQYLKKHTNLRFPGGAIGYVSYDAGRFIEKLPNIAKDDLELPDMLFIIPKELIIFDHGSDKITATSEKGRQLIEEAQTKSTLSTIPTKKTFKPNISKRDFKKIVSKAKEYIKNGDIYQVNLSQRLETDVRSDPFHIYKTLRNVNPSPFASYLNFGDLKLISCSPERQILLENGIAETRPIAGTRPRGKNEDQDDKLTGELLLNEKERAEHIMLVDLERNDIGRVCEYGSVHADELMVVEKYSHVMHIVSNVKGKIRKDKDQFDLFKACFPGGTITGCPKIRSMEIIEELEPVKRGPYTGTIGYFGFNGNMDMSITIRTIVLKDKKAYVQVGAGIVFDSQPEFEYYETLHKAQAMLKAIEIAEGSSK
ncbi:anthranilate synthase component I [Candidatus Margulisiibacteriota bacterium]